MALPGQSEGRIASSPSGRKGMCTSRRAEIASVIILIGLIPTEVGFDGRHDCAPLARDSSLPRSISRSRSRRGMDMTSISRSCLKPRQVVSGVMAR